MDRINIVASLGNNTGKTTGDVRMGRIKALLLIKGLVLSAADLADSDSLAAALEAAMLKSRSSVDKLILIDGFREVEDGTGDPNVGTLADGYEEVLNEALPKYTLRHTKGVAQAMSLAALNGWNDAVLIVDDKNVFWYIGKADGGGKGFSVGSLYTQPPKFGGTGNINTGVTKITLGDIEQFKSMIGAIKLDFNVSDLQNIVDVELSEVAAAAGYVFTIGAKTKFAGTDIYETYQNLLAVIGAWKATRLDTGADVPIDTVVKDAVNKGWDITLDDTTAIGAGVKVKIELKDPAALAALGTPVEGIEGYPVVVTKP